ncbi:hypothetical protein Tsubulata_001822 [Turnera subulata]|uniref:Uncharacterized protein n=1 Tax=Turnera subulata TaxID=218843 RepID=A0A9Q0G3D4_9ROSI|nr:hypothetical protein Tsubulata_001822 [Turnera subulata]
MRCKKHPCDQSSSVGVCASCLRECLLALMAAQAQHQAQLPSDDDHPTSRKPDHHHHHHPPLIFPRSVSPYVTRRKSDDPPTSCSHPQPRHLLFYSTPQVGPTHNSNSNSSSHYYARKQHHRARSSSLFSSLFRSRSEKFNPDPAGSSPSWFSSFFSRRRRKQSLPAAASMPMEYSAASAARRPRRVPDRGMSPGSEGEWEEDCDPWPSGSGCSSSESAHGWNWKKTPVVGAVRRGKGGGHEKSVSGLTFCLSPLVRASPSRHWNHKGGVPPDEVRAQGKPHLSAAASYCANRSRKLADFGRVNNHNC